MDGVVGPRERAVVQLHGACKRFGTTVVLNDVSFAVSPAEKLVVIGASGSGKTTLLRCVVGLERLDDGTIEIDGELLLHQRVNGKLVAAPESHVRRVRSAVGMVFQQFNLFPHMTVLENLIVAPVAVRHVPRAQACEEARALLAKVGLSDKIDMYAAQLSGGQQQRVAIARALALRPKLMLFDEVTSALDPQLVGEVLNVMRQLAESGMTMIIVTHHMGFAAQVADRVMFMDGGSIVEEGPPEQVLRKPQVERTRDFLRLVMEH
jgi:polar amino acid transport system ATP-binding protein